jgi:hypothetical protein
MLKIETPYNQYNLPEEMIVALGIPRPIIDHVYSVTEFISPTRMIRLKRQCHKDGIALIEQPERKLKALLGTGFHMAMQKANEELQSRWCISDDNNQKQPALIEQTVKAKFDKVTLVGHFDLWKEGVLSDYKTTSVYAFLLGEKIEWEQQLNLYRYCLKMGYSGLPQRETTSLVIKALLVDWKQNKCLLDSDYPPMPFIEKEIPIWSDGTILAFINSKVEQLYSEKLPLCTSEEQWARPETWAVMKNDNKKASRVLETEEQAIAWCAEHEDKKNKLSIMKRIGLKVRCAEYCQVRDYCEQYDKESVNIETF